MTASTGTARGGLGNQQLGLALAGAALVAAILAGGLAIGQLTKVQLAPIAPAAAPAPAFDHGTATWGEAAAPTFDHGSADLSAAASSTLNHGAAWDPALSSGAGVSQATPFTLFPNGARRGYDGTESGVSRVAPLSQNGAHYDSELGIWETTPLIITTRPGNPGHNHAPAYDASPNRFEDHTHPNFSSDSSLYRARD